MPIRTHLSQRLHVKKHFNGHPLSNINSYFATIRNWKEKHSQLIGNKERKQDTALHILIVQNVTQILIGKIVKDNLKAERIHWRAAVVNTRPHPVKKDIFGLHYGGLLKNIESSTKIKHRVKYFF